MPKAQKTITTQDILDLIHKREQQVRAEMTKTLYDAVASENAHRKATAAAAPVKRGPGRPRKNPAPEVAAAPVKRKPGRPRKNPATEASAAPATKKKAKAKRVISEEARKKLAENLRKAREAKAAKAKPAKRKAKSDGGEAASAPAQA